MLAMSVLERLSYVVTILDRWQVLAVSGCHCRDLLLKDLSGTVQNYWQICFIVVEPETFHNSRWHYENGVPNRSYGSHAMLEHVCHYCLLAGKLGCHSAQSFHFH